MTVPAYDFVLSNQITKKIELAEAFSYSHLVIVYRLPEIMNITDSFKKEELKTFNTYMQELEQTFRMLQDTTSVELIPCFECNSREDVVLMRHKQDTFHSFFRRSPKVCRVTIDDDITTILRKTSCTIYTGLETHRSYDFFHHRNAGINHVIAKEFVARNMFYLFDLHSFYVYEGRREAKKRNLIQARQIGRLQQNLRLCQKYGVGYLVGSFADTWNEISLFDDMITLFGTDTSHKEWRRQFEAFIKLFR